MKVNENMYLDEEGHNRDGPEVKSWGLLFTLQVEKQKIYVFWYLEGVLKLLPHLKS